jgi:hypothetical protein
LDESISKEWRNKASDLRTQYIAFMEAFPPSVNDLWGKRPTHQEIFDVMVYGNLVKVNNPDKRAKYKEWTKDDIRKFVLQQEFTKVMLAIYAFVADLADITVLELSKPNKDSASLA